MDGSTKIKVLNRDNGSVIYSIPEMNGLRRAFQTGETKEISFEELQKLSYIPGGKELLEDSLVILNNDEAVKELVGDVEPEYKYTKDKILDLMKNGTLDEFLDCLDFAPEGVKELIKTYAVELPLNDVPKREAIAQKLNFNVDNAIRIKKETEEDEPPVNTTHERRVKVENKTETEKETKTRRTVVK